LIELVKNINILTEIARPFVMLLLLKLGMAIIQYRAMLLFVLVNQYAELLKFSRSQGFMVRLGFILSTGDYWLLLKRYYP